MTDTAPPAATAAERCSPGCSIVPKSHRPSLPSTVARLVGSCPSKLQSTSRSQSSVMSGGDPYHAVSLSSGRPLGEWPCSGVQAGSSRTYCCREHS
eukprot:1211441-Pyramimonas_sp.AAC.1